jgi:uncharacterized protein DUF4870
MSTDDTPQPPNDAETAADHDVRPTRPPQDGSLTASDVKTYATLAHVGVVVVALVTYPFMWVPPLAFFLVFRSRDQAGLLRRHLGQALSFSAVLTIYAMVLHQVLVAVNVGDLVVDLLPVLVAAVAAYPSLRAVQAAQRLEPYDHPKALAWIPVDR